MERRRCDAASGVAEAPPGVEPLNQHPLPPSSSTRTMPDTGWKSPVIILSTFNLWRKVCYRVIEVLTFGSLTKKFKDMIILRRDNTMVYGHDITLLKIDGATWFAVYIFFDNILGIFSEYFGHLYQICTNYYSMLSLYYLLYFIFWRFLISYKSLT